MAKQHAEDFEILISDRVSAEKSECLVPIKLPLKSLSSLFKKIRRVFNGIGDFEVRFKVKKEEHLLCAENLQEVGSLIANGTVKKLYLVAQTEGKRARSKFTLLNSRKKGYLDKKSN